LKPQACDACENHVLLRIPGDTEAQNRINIRQYHQDETRRGKRPSHRDRSTNKRRFDFLSASRTPQILVFGELTIEAIGMASRANQPKLGWDGKVHFNTSESYSYRKTLKITFVLA
jgi:hypothetical protein